MAGEEREYIVYLEVDVTVKLKSGVIRDAEKIAKEMITSVSPLVVVDEVRFVTSEQVKKSTSSTSRTENV
jgi:hypothetical protein